VIEVAIVGLGEWGQNLVRSIQGKSAKLRFAAAATRTPSKVAAFAAEHGMALRGDYRAVLADPALAAVVLATPHTLHAEQIVAAAEAGKPVFVEKPLALTGASARAAVAACAKAGVALGVGYNRRHAPAMMALKRMVDEGTLGRVLQIEANFSSNSGYRQGPAAWRANRAESPAGGMTSLGVHALDAMIHLGGAIGRVEALSRHLALPIDIDDTTAILCEFRAGALGYLGTVYASAPFWRLHVFGSEGWAEMRGLDTLVTMSRAGKTEEIKFPATDTVRLELEAFADAIASGARLTIPASELVNGVEALEAINLSATSGRAAAIATD